MSTEQRVETSSGLAPSAGRGCPTLFAVEVSAAAGQTVLTLHGELDISSQQVFAAALAGVDESAPRIVLDLSDLTFIDCANISLIHRSRVRAGLRGTFLELRSPTPDVRRILELTGLSEHASNGNGAGPVALPLPARVYDGPSGRVVYQAT